MEAGEEGTSVVQLFILGVDNQETDRGIRSFTFLQELQVCCNMHTFFLVFPSNVKAQIGRNVLC